MPRTTIGQRWRVVALREAGMSSRAISARLGIPKSTVCDIFNRHAQRPGDVADRHRSGRPRKTTPREDRRLGRIALRKRFCTSMELRRRWHRIPRATIRRLVASVPHPLRACVEAEGVT